MDTILLESGDGLLGEGADELLLEYDTTGSGLVVVAHDTGMTVDVPMQMVTLDWEADESGVASGEISLRGILANVSFEPGAAPYQPTNNYDVTILDNAGADVLGGAGANLSNTTPKRIAPVADTTIAVRHQSPYEPLTVSIANAGAGSRGTIRLYLKCY